jgi:hypothetical protein
MGAGVSVGDHGDSLLVETPDKEACYACRKEQGLTKCSCFLTIHDAPMSIDMNAAARLSGEDFDDLVFSNMAGGPKGVISKQFIKDLPRLLDIFKDKKRRSLLDVAKAFNVELAAVKAATEGNLQHEILNLYDGRKFAELVTSEWDWLQKEREKDVNLQLVSLASLASGDFVEGNLMKLCFSFSESRRKEVHQFCTNRLRLKTFHIMPCGGIHSLPHATRVVIISGEHITKPARLTHPHPVNKKLADKTSYEVILDEDQDNSLQFQGRDLVIDQTFENLDPELRAAYPRKCSFNASSEMMDYVMNVMLASDHYANNIVPRLLKLKPPVRYSYGDFPAWFSEHWGKAAYNACNNGGGVLLFSHTIDYETDLNCMLERMFCEQILAPEFGRGCWAEDSVLYEPGSQYRLELEKAAAEAEARAIGERFEFTDIKGDDIVIAVNKAGRLDYFHCGKRKVRDLTKCGVDMTWGKDPSGGSRKVACAFVVIVWDR